MFLSDRYCTFGENKIFLEDTLFFKWCNMFNSAVFLPGLRNKYKYITFILFSGALLLLSGCSGGWDIQNPYESVNWDTYIEYKSNLHTHTTRSDGRLNPQSVVDKYHALGYTILALSDHNAVTYPWTDFAAMEPSNRSKERVENDQLEAEMLEYEDRDPSQLGMFAIQSNELSRHHHMGSYFNDHDGTSTEEESLQATKAKNGLTAFMHPGRYQFGVGWYADFYKRYPHLVGQEVYNQGDRYPNDRILWDSILVEIIRERPVWGFSNDDMHSGSRLGFNWNVFVLPELNEESIRRGMMEGSFFYVYSPHGHDGPAPASIRSIDVNRKKGTITLSVSGEDSIRWISSGQIIHRGHAINLNKVPAAKAYVRAEIYSSGEAVTGTQPFRIARK